MKMSKSKHLLGAIVLCCAGIAQLPAAEGDVQSQGYMNLLLNNEFLLENARLLKLAEESFAESKYAEAISYAEEAEKYATLSDEFVTLQMLIRETNQAISAAEARIAWAKSIGAPTSFAEIYQEAEKALAEAVDFRTNEKWAEAKASALRVISILDGLPAERPLPAQYLVRTWVQWRDCLWNIAAKPEIYGDPWQWRRLYEANKDKMPEAGNPDLIHPGMILDIPSIRGETRSGILEGD